MPMTKAIFDAIAKATKAPTFDEKLKIFEVADACNNDKELIRYRAMIKILPVPGPKKPS